MKKIITFLFSLLVSFVSIAHSNDVVQGPFKIDEGKNVYFKKESNENYPLSLYFDVNGQSCKIDTYETDGALPNIDTVFFEKIKGIKNVIVLVSWHQQHVAENINGYSYQVYGYKYKDSQLSINDEIVKDPRLNGLDGEFNGENSSFKYKDAASIRKYLRAKYGK